MLIFFTVLLFLHILIEFLLGRGQFSKAHFQSGDFLGENLSWVLFLGGGEHSGEHFDWIEKKKVKNTSENCAFRKQCNKNVRFLGFLASRRFGENFPPRNFSNSLNEAGIFYAKSLQKTNYTTTNREWKCRIQLYS